MSTTENKTNIEDADKETQPRTVNSQDAISINNKLQQGNCGKSLKDKPTSVSMEQQGLMKDKASYDKEITIRGEHLQDQQEESATERSDEIMGDKIGKEIVISNVTELQLLAIEDNHNEQEEMCQENLLEDVEELVTLLFPDKLQGDNDKGLVEQKPESPMRILHNIVSHQVAKNTGHKHGVSSDNCEHKPVKYMDEDGV